MRFLLLFAIALFAACSDNSKSPTAPTAPTAPENQTFELAARPLTATEDGATLTDLPTHHGGESFTLTVTLTGTPVNRWRTVKDSTVNVDGGSVDRVRRAHGDTAADRNYVWEATVAPDEGDVDVTITVRSVSATVPASEPDTTTVVTPPDTTTTVTPPDTTTTVTPPDTTTVVTPPDTTTVVTPPDTTTVVTPPDTTTVVTPIVETLDNDAPPVLSNVPVANTGAVFTFTVTYVEGIPSSRSVVVDDIEIDGATVYSVKRAVKTGPDMNKVWNVMIVPDSQYVPLTIRVRGATAEIPDHVSYTEAIRRANMVDNVTFRRTTVGVTEGTCDGSAEFKLGHEANATVTLDATGEPIEFLVGTERVKTQSVDFDTTNWDSNQTVTICGLEDSDTKDDSFTVDVTAVGGNYVDYSSELTVNVIDDDEPHIVFISPSPSKIRGAHNGTDNPSIRVREGQTLTLKWRIGTKPNYDGTEVQFVLNQWEKKWDDPWITSRTVPDLHVRPVSGDGTPRYPIIPGYPSHQWNKPHATYSVTVTIKRDSDQEDEEGIFRLGTVAGFWGGMAPEYKYRYWDIEVTVIDKDK